eukprot:TRINITY_DN4600_c0_g1_i12.p3 TRINITY_DN4600_c0_g1~~TRINITY_DN4600_c0_g1_i12.p3  ORF type:complete len:221 (-),score=31.95 TRINITY_DN4600_c0_g1_i12:314-976(-)
MAENMTTQKKCILEEEDIAKMISSFNFPLTSEQLIQKAKTFCKTSLANLQDDQGISSMLADDFEFVAPVIGPLNKEEYCDAIKFLDFNKMMPDFVPNQHSFMIDPFKPNRVWWMSAGRGTNTGPLPGGKKPSGKEYIGPPEVSSVTFNEKGLVTKITTGYVVDKQEGNTGGLGGAFGMFYAFGTPLPFPEGKPYKRSWQFSFFMFMQRLFAGKKQKKSDS